MTICDGGVNYSVIGAIRQSFIKTALTMTPEDSTLLLSPNSETCHNSFTDKYSEDVGEQKT